jgi:hypothetical protein
MNRTRKKSNPYLVVKSNRLINVRLNGMTISQLRFFEILIAQLDRGQQDFSRQRVYLKEFVSRIGTRNKNEHQRAREVTKSMMKHVVEIMEEPSRIQTLIPDGFNPTPKTPLILRV